MKTLTFYFLTLISLAGVAQQRVVLVEQFTNAGCPFCAMYTPSIEQKIDADSSNIVAVAYHTLQPHYDSIYYENPTESNARQTYYSVTGYPTSVLDGNVFNSASANLIPIMDSVVTSRLVVSSPYKINIVNASLAGNQLQVKVLFTSLSSSNITDSITAHVVVIEKTVYKSSYASGYPGNNSETKYEYVMRKMLPNSTGTSLYNKFLNASDTLNFTWTLAKIKNTSQLRVVAFVQNNQTKEIYEAQLGMVFFTTNTAGIATNYAGAKDLIIYPNPTKGLVTFNLGGSIGALFTITNNIGQLVKAGNFTKSTTLDVSDLDNGVYFVNITQNNQNVTTKIIVQK
jgi:hypothetical protein